MPRVRYGVWGLAAVLAVVLALSGQWNGLRAQTASPANRISSIAPACADPGAEVLVQGIGFGALNARVTVGGVAAEIRSAVGNALTFVVPAAVPSGPTDVVVTHKSGSQFGRIGFRVRCAPPRPGVQLDGVASDPAISAVRDYYAGLGVPAAAIESDSNGVRIARSRFEVAFAPAATVGDVNAVLQSVDGRITSMLAGVLIVMVDIPDPGSVAELDQVLATVRAMPAVRFVQKATFTSPDELPPGYPPDQPEAFAAGVGHHLAIGAHAAWNARLSLTQPSAAPPLVVVSDDFGASVTNSDDAYDVIDTPTDYGTNDPPNPHGFHVLGIIAASYPMNPEGPEGSSATGIYPSTTLLRVADTYSTGGANDLGTLQNLALQRVKSAGGPAILNTSWGSDCATVTVPLASPCSPAEAAQLALIWIEKVRGSSPLLPQFNLENRFLHVTSAGNIKADGASDSRLNSAFTAAANLTGLTSNGTPVANLTNTIAVENRQRTTELPLAPACLASTSKRQGNLSAIGTQVWSLISNTDAGYLDGTSMAAPQVTGLAAYVWALDPTLTPQQVAGLLAATARTMPGDAACGETPAPVIDAYAAVLAADQSLTAAPARRAILDVADANGLDGSDGVFDINDVNLFLENFTAAAGRIDYSRYDLNGDGRTGGETTARFDLDINRVPTYSHVVQTIERTTITFDERAVTDQQVLCYYAYADGLFSVGSDPTLRRDALAGPCGSIAASGGVFTSVLSATPGTSMLLKLRGSDGAPLPAPATVVVEGPAGWPAQSGVYPRGATRQWYTFAPAPITGWYTVTANIGGIERSTRFHIDATRRLDVPSVMVVTPQSSSTVEGSWAAVANAESYLGRVVLRSTQTIQTPVRWTNAPYALLTGLSLSANVEYAYQAYAFSNNMTVSDVPVPPQFDVSFNRRIFTLRMTVTPTGQVVAPGDQLGFSANLALTDQRVTWTASGGAISPSGVWSAPFIEGAYTITATSVADPSFTASAIAIVDGGGACSQARARSLWDGAWSVSGVPSAYSGNNCRTVPEFASFLNGGTMTINNGNVLFADGIKPIQSSNFIYACDTFFAHGQGSFFESIVSLTEDPYLTMLEGQRIVFGLVTLASSTTPGLQPCVANVQMMRR